MSLGEVDRVAETNNVPQKVRAMAETLQNAGHFLTTGFCAPLIVNFRDCACGILVFDDVNFYLWVSHALSGSAQFSGEYHNVCG